MDVQTARPAAGGRGMSAADSSDEILDQVMSQVPGLTDKNELELLHDLARQSRRTIVELGAAWGRSTVALCLGAQTGGVDVVTVDTFAWIAQGSPTEESIFPDGVKLPTKENLAANLAAFGFAPQIIDDQTWQAAGQVADGVGLLFIDADHSGAAVERDLAAWVPKLAPGAIILFHDYENELCPDVTPVADAWAYRQGWHKAECAGYLQAFRMEPAAQNGVAAAYKAVGTGEAANAVYASDDAQVADAKAIVDAYLQAFAARDLVSCIEFFADDATLIFVKRFAGRVEIEQWHEQRFKAKVEILNVLATEATGNTVTVDMIVTSNRLKFWRIKLQGRAIICVDENKIRTMELKWTRWVK